MTWVWAGVILESTDSRYHLLIIHLAAFLTLAIIFSVAGRDIKPPTWRFPQSEWLASLLLIASVGFILVHWIKLGGMPAVVALKSTDYMEIAKLRQSVTEHGALFNYVSIFLIRVMLPLLVLRYVLKEQYWIALMVGSFGAVYGLSLMQKSYPIFIVAPAIVYLAFRGWRAAAFCGIRSISVRRDLGLDYECSLAAGEFLWHSSGVQRSDNCSHIASGPSPRGTRSGSQRLVECVPYNLSIRARLWLSLSFDCFEMRFHQQFCSDVPTLFP